MDLLEQPALACGDATADATEPTEAMAAAHAPATDTDAAALLGLPPGVSAPEGVEALVTPAAAARQVEWYHLDPNDNYQELRLGEGPGLGRGLAFGGLLSVLAVGLFYGCMWFVEPSAALLNPFIDRSYAESRDTLAAHLGGLSPVPLSGVPVPGSATTTTTTTTTTQPARDVPKFDLADLRSAHRESPGGAIGGGATTWYRFDLPREQVSLYREHLLRRWLDHLKHRVEDGGNDPAFQSTSAPAFWDSKEFDDGTRLRLLRGNGDVAFQAAFCATRGRVYIRVNH